MFWINIYIQLNISRIENQQKTAVLDQNNALKTMTLGAQVQRALVFKLTQPRGVWVKCSLRLRS